MKSITYFRALYFAPIVMLFFVFNSCAASLEHRKNPIDVVSFSHNQAAMHLAEMGLYKASFDPLDEEVFQAALLRFQKLKHLKSSGMLDHATWRELEKVRIRSSRKNVYEGFQSNMPTIRLVQERLKASGFNPGPIDGKWGKKTRSALIIFSRK